jgi:hypothetical protein
MKAHQQTNPNPSMQCDVKFYIAFGIFCSRDINTAESWTDGEINDKGLDQ